MSYARRLIIGSVALGLSPACTDSLADHADQEEQPDASSVRADAVAESCSTADGGACSAGCAAGELSETVNLWTGTEQLVDAAAVDGRLGVAMGKGSGNTTVAQVGLADLDAMDAGFEHLRGLGGGGSLYSVRSLSLTARPGGFTAAYSNVNHTYGTARCHALTLGLNGGTTAYTVDLRSGRGCDDAHFTWAGDGYSLLAIGTPKNLIVERYPFSLATSRPTSQHIDDAPYTADMRQQSWDGERLFVTYRKQVATTDGVQNVKVFARVAGRGVPVQVSSAPGMSYWPTIASGADGTAVAWIDATPDRSSFAKRFTVLDSSARPRFPPVDLQTSKYYTARGLSLAAGSASYAVAWVDAQRIWFTEIDAAGRVLAPARIIETGAQTVRLVADERDYWAVWQADGAIRAKRICGS